MNRLTNFFSIFIITTNLFATSATFLNKESICKAPYKENAILRNDPLFIDDFLTLHSLLRIINPASLFEIGTCTGEGTLIIKNAIGNGTVYSLELPPGQSSYDLPSPGEMCYLPFTQIFGNSMTFDYKNYYPIQSWFIDGAHEYSYVLYETHQALSSSPKIIIWHDADIPEVFQAIKDGLEQDPTYLLFRVIDTRIAFAVPNTSILTEVIKK